MFTILMIIIDTYPKHEAWHCDATSQFGGPEKTLCTDVVITAHAQRENHYATLVHNSEISQIYIVQIGIENKSQLNKNKYTV